MENVCINTMLLGLHCASDLDHGELKYLPVGSLYYVFLTFDGQNSPTLKLQLYTNRSFV